MFLPMSIAGAFCAALLTGPLAAQGASKAATRFVDTLTAAEFTAAAAEFNLEEDRIKQVSWYRVGLLERPPIAKPINAAVVRNMMRFYSDGLKRIEPVLRSDGGMLYFESLYRGQDWLFHEEVSVRIGDALFTTPPFSPGSPQIIQKVRTGYVEEIITHTGPTSRTIIEAIAKADSATPILVRLRSRNNTIFDFEMAPVERRKFTAAWRMYVTLLARQSKKP